jgi:hypothetical protein
MKVVDETKSIRAIEEKVSSGMIEELIFQAHNELKLIRIMKNWKPWEYLAGEVHDKEGLLNMINMKHDNPFPAVSENYDSMRHNRPTRKPTASLHPEDGKYGTN